MSPPKPPHTPPVPPVRDKLPTLSDYVPTRERPAIEEHAIRRLFPRDSIESRMMHVESVLYDVVKVQIDQSPKVEAAHEYINDEANARTSAIAYAGKLATLTAITTDIKKTQIVRETRTKFMNRALAAPILVFCVGLLAHVDTAQLVSAVTAIGVLALGLVNSMAKKAGDSFVDGNSLPPPPNKQ